MTVGLSRIAAITLEPFQSIGKVNCSSRFIGKDPVQTRVIMTFILASAFYERKPMLNIEMVDAEHGSEPPANERGMLTSYYNVRSKNVRK